MNNSFLKSVRKRLRNSETREYLYRSYLTLGIVERSPFDNIYHCCTQKTASQAFRAIFDDPDVYHYTGLKQIPYRKLGLREAEITEPFPDKTIASTLYVNFPTYEAIPKGDAYRTFFITRDPRDIVVSWYYSMKFSHKEVGPVSQFRQELQELDQRQGLIHSIDTLDEIGLFEAQRSWMYIPDDQKDICKIFRYEDFAENLHMFLTDLFEFLQIRVPEEKFLSLCKRHSFEARTGGRKQGQEDRKRHLRKGQPGDWEEHFDAEITAYFADVTGDLVELLGYS